MVNFTSLPSNVQLQTISYLDVRSTYLGLSNVCKSLNELVANNKLVAFIMLNQLIDNGLPQDFINARTTQEMIEILKSTYNSLLPDIELPFYAFKSDGGVDENEPRHFFGPLFRAKEVQSICTKIGENFNVHAALAYNYYIPEDLEMRAELPLDDEEIVNLEEHLLSDKFNVINYLEQQPIDNYNLEVNYTALNKLAIVKGLRISRAGKFSCPVRTLMFYISNEKIEEEDDEMVKLIGNLSSTLEMRALYIKHSASLPQIYMTNVEKMKPWAEICEKNDPLMNIIIFKNSQRASKAKPMAWIQFNNSNKKLFHIKLQKPNFFSGKFLLTKLLDCDDLTIQEEDEIEETNIDISYISFRGQLINDSL